MEIKFYEHPKFGHLTLLASLPDMGRVGGLVPKFLVDHLKAKLFAEIYTYDKPYVICKDGLISHFPTIYRLYYSRRGSLIIMTGEEQPQEVSALYDLCNTVLDVAGKCGKVDRVYTAGGYFREQLKGEPRVFGVANVPNLLQELDRVGIREIGSEISNITWFNGLVLGVSRTRNIDSIGLYGELDNPQVPQPQAAKAVVKALVTLLSLPQIDSMREDVSTFDVVA